MTRAVDTALNGASAETEAIRNLHSSVILADAGVFFHAPSKQIAPECVSAMIQGETVECIYFIDYRTCPDESCFGQTVTPRRSG